MNTPEVDGSATPSETASSEESSRAQLKVDLEGVRQFLSDADETLRLETDYLREYCSKLLEIINRETGTYEKLMIADGTALALSLNFMSSLSGHLASVHPLPHPHLWMVSLSWCLLMFSIFCSFRVVVSRNHSTRRILAKISLKQSSYLHTRMQRNFQQIQGAITGAVSVDGKSVNVSDLFKVIAESVKESGKKRSDEIEAVIKEIETASVERPLAHAALWSSFAGLVLLCFFAIRAISLFF